jgi:uncharacterized protein DUF1844
MSDTGIPQEPVQSASPAQIQSALFAQLVMQQANMALMLLGKVPHPESGQAVKDVEAARLFIDQLEMLEAKTKGNLNKEESGLLKQTLMSLRLAFVEAVDETPKKPEPQPQPKPAADQPSSPPAPPAEEEHHKKFSKKY